MDLRETPTVKPMISSETDGPFTDISAVFAIQLYAHITEVGILVRQNYQST